MSRHAAAPYTPQSPLCSAIPLQICIFVFNYFHDAPPPTSFFSSFCIVAQGCVPLSAKSAKIWGLLKSRFSTAYELPLHFTPLCVRLFSSIYALPNLQALCFENVATV